ALGPGQGPPWPTNATVAILEALIAPGRARATGSVALAGVVSTTTCLPASAASAAVPADPIDPSPTSICAVPGTVSTIVRPIPVSFCVPGRTVIDVGASVSRLP